ncbi:MAG: MgtC/SapB family protein [Acidimicrobiia bacterium]
MTDLFARLGAALAIGLLVGLQREYAGHGSEKAMFAGARTFALIGLAGGVAAHLSDAVSSPAIFVAALLLIGALTFIGYFVSTTRDGDVGQTTEVAAIVVFLSGGLAVVGNLAVAAAIGVATTTLLTLKPQTRKLAANLDPQDVYATVKFAVLALLVLPILPTETFGPSPFDAASPFRVGLMVLFISGLSFVGYALIQFVGPQRGVVLTGVLGGLVSSTAVTLTLSGQSKKSDELAYPLALGLLMAWAIMFARVIVEVAVVNPALLSEVWPSITAGGVAGLAAASFIYARQRSGSNPLEDAEFKNPFRLMPALQFGLLYGVILIISKAASESFGDAGVYFSAVASGIADVDAVTLSLAELSIGDGTIANATAANAIALAAVTNTLVKGLIVLAIGHGRLRRIIIPGIVAMVGATLLVAALV